MALIQCDFYSETLQKDTSMTVVLPQGTNKSNKLKTLWLLHGYNGNNTVWHRNSAIERYVSDLEIAVVMPDAHKSFYTNMVYGLPYWTFISEELPEIARRFFPLSQKREDNSVAGLSMGGYGAFKLAISFPNRFCCAGSFSGAVDLAPRIKPSEPGSGWRAVYGENPDISDTENDLVWLLKKQKKKKMVLPQLYQCCGTEDFLYDSNLSFIEHLRDLEIPVTYVEDPGYEHSWDYWDLKIQHYLKWMKESGFI